MVYGLTQKLPPGHREDCMDPAVQKSPILQATIMIGVGQKLPTGHCEDDVEPTAQ